jgi:shikimate dehydrogenase
MQLSGKTMPFAVLGHPIGHTLSPIMHNRSLQALGLDAIYLAFDVPPEKLMAVLPAMRDMGFRGVNLTVPLKEVACRGLPELAESARLAGSVNTVEFMADGVLRGHSTDGTGFVRAIDEAFGCAVAGQRIFVLGSGGAGRAVAITCATEGAAEIAVADIDLARAAKVVDELAALDLPRRPRAHCVGHSATDWIEAARQADLIVQATPVGMQPDDRALLPAAAFRPGQMLFDMIYMYPATAVIRLAAERGARTANGLGMLLHQGARSFEIWTGLKPDVAAMRAALEEAVYGPRTE